MIGSAHLFERCICNYPNSVLYYPLSPNPYSKSGILTLGKYYNKLGADFYLLFDKVLLSPERL